MTNKNIGNYFGATIDRPYHLSVGGVILDENNNVYCLYYPHIDHLNNIYVLPNKTVKPGETLEETLKRGAMSELGCEIEPITFLGTLAVKDVWWAELGTPTAMEKSVLFFLARATHFSQEIIQADSKNLNCEIQIKPFDFLIESMKKLQVKDGMRDFDQLEIVIRARDWVTNHPALISETI